MPGTGIVMPTSLERTNTQESTEAERILEDLVREHYTYIRRLALTILDDGSSEGGVEADDATQETFITAYRSLSGFRGNASLKTWLTSIAVNACRARLRKRKLRQALHGTLSGLQRSQRLPSPEEATVKNEAHHQIWQAVDNLDEKHRLPVILHYVHELTVPEIAASLGINEGTIYSRLHYARKALLDRLGSYHEEALDEPFV